MHDVHATCVAIEGLGVLLRGKAGAGKSDLALRLIDGGALLVADDRTSLTVEEGRLVASAPETIAGKLEIRGVGILDLPTAASAAVALAVDLVAAEAVERLPEQRWAEFHGIRVPLLALAPFEASAAAKIRLAVRALAARSATG